MATLKEHLRAELSALETETDGFAKANPAQKRKAESLLDQIQEVSDNDELLAFQSGVGELTVGAKRARDRQAKARQERAETTAAIDNILGRGGRGYVAGPLEHVSGVGESGGLGLGLYSALKAAGFDHNSNPKVEVPLAPVLGVRSGMKAMRSGAKANVVPSAELYDTRTLPDVYALGSDQDWLYRWFPIETVGLETSVTDFVSTARSISGTVERTLDAVTSKADASATLSATNVELYWYACTSSTIPVAVLESIAGARAFYEQEMVFEINRALDDAVLAAIVASSPGTESSSGDAITDVRNCVATMKAAGYRPNVLALSHAAAADLDLSLQPSVNSNYIFPVRDSGSASPLWGLQVVECQAMSNDHQALVLDTNALGVVFLGNLRTMADPYSGMKENTVDLLAEFKARPHIRQSGAARYVPQVS